MDRAPRLLRLLVALAPLVLTLLAAPSHATGEDASEHRRATPTPTQPTVEAYAVPVSRRVTYSVRTRGRVTASMKVFRRQAQETFDHPRGWRAAGVAVPPGAAGRRLHPRARRGRHAAVVLRRGARCGGRAASGRHVVINQLRWRHASPAWNRAGRSLRDYRHLVVNHETGHWLGRGHAGCHRRGRAPVMMQQSKGTGGCRFNPWPLPWEAAAVRRR